MPCLTGWVTLDTALEKAKRELVFQGLAGAIIEKDNAVLAVQNASLVERQDELQQELTQARQKLRARVTPTSPDSAPAQRP